MDADLSLVSTEDLVQELFSRFDAAIFNAAKAQQINPTEDGLAEGYINFVGDAHTCAGLAGSMEYFILSGLHESGHKLEGD